MTPDSASALAPEVCRAFVEHVAALGIGKRLPTAVYVHESVLGELPQLLRRLIASVRDQTRRPSDWNLFKLGTREATLSLLCYPEFDEHAFPRLWASLKCNFETGERSSREYSHDDRAPILHRKELFVPERYVLREEFVAVTEELEEAGAFSETRAIGTLGAWKARLAECGYTLVDGRLLRAELFDGPEAWNAQRGRTALSRSAPSLPVQLMQRLGWLDGRYSVLDYGCGRGFDVSYLEHLGVDTAAWDPVHRPSGTATRADLVNLGFVVNVIESADEREDVLSAAFALAKSALVVSVMVAPPSRYERFLPFRDGVVTARGTFQKYYTQTEIKELVEQVTGVEVFGVGPGVVVAFRDGAMREAFRERRYRRRPRTGVGAIGSAMPSNRTKAAEFWRARSETCADLWSKACELGRWPESDEFAATDVLLEFFSSRTRAFHAVSRFFDGSELEAAAERRREDLLLEDAIARFNRTERRISEFSIPKQRDVRSFFGSFRALSEASQANMRTLADPAVLTEAALAVDRAECGGCWDDSGVSFERRCVDRLPLPLRTYIELGAAYHGGFEGVDLVRVHLESGKLTLSAFDDFYGRPLPLLLTRTKVDLRRQRIDDFEYGEGFASPPLYWKSRFLAEDAPSYRDQARFDRKLDELGIAPEGDPRFGFSANVVDEILTAKGLEVRGFRFFKLGRKGAS